MIPILSSLLIFIPSWKFQSTDFLRNKLHLSLSRIYFFLTFGSFFFAFALQMKFLKFLSNFLHFDSILLILNLNTCAKLDIKKSGCGVNLSRYRLCGWKWKFFSRNVMRSHRISIMIRKKTAMAHVRADDEGGERKKKVQSRIQKQIMRRSCATPRPPNGQFVFADCLYLGTLSWTKIAVSSFL